MKNFTRRFKIAAIFILFAGLTMLSFQLQAQLTSKYRLNFSREKPANLTGGTILASGGGVGSAIDDTIFPNQNIGFSFVFNGVNYTQVSISSNGFIWFGDTTGMTNNYYPISSSLNYAGAISAFGKNLTGQSSSSAIVTETSGTAPNRSFTVEWMQFVADSVYSSTNNTLDLFITLYECSGEIKIADFVDSSSWTAGNIVGQLGLRDATNSNFYNISINCSTSTWLAPDTGTSNISTVSIGNCFPDADSIAAVFLYFPVTYSGLTISCLRIPNLCFLTPQDVTINGSGGFPPYSINWAFTAPDSTIDSGEASPITFPYSIADSFKQAGYASYALTVTDSIGCMASCDELNFSVDVCSNHFINEVSLPNGDTSACQCSNFQIPYTSTGIYNGNNTFMVELSNDTGSFDSAVVIGQLFTNQDTGVISATLPCNMPPGNGYKIRVTANSPVIIGADSTSATFVIIKNDTASVQISTLSSIICPGENATFIANEDSGVSHPTFQWMINGRNVVDSGQGNIFSVDTLSNGDTISVVLTLTGTCTLNSPDTSNTITIMVSGSAAPPKPIVNVHSNDSLVASNICSACKVAWHHTTDTTVLSTDSILVVNTAGEYYVTVMDTATGCSNISNEVSITFTGIKVLAAATQQLFIYPDPCFVCVVSGNPDPKDLIVTDLLGRTLNTTFNQTAGGYEIQIASDEGGLLFLQNRKTGQVMKFIKD